MPSPKKPEIASLVALPGVFREFLGQGPRNVAGGKAGPAHPGPGQRIGLGLFGGGLLRGDADQKMAGLDLRLGGGERSEPRFAAVREQVQPCEIPRNSVSLEAVSIL